MSRRYVPRISSAAAGGEGFFPVSGPAAVSGIFGDKPFHRTNSCDIEGYIKSPSAAASIEYLDRTAFMAEHFITGMRLFEGLDRDLFRSRFGIGPSQAAPETTARWREAGYLGNDSYALNNHGMMLLDSFIEDVYLEISR